MSNEERRPDLRPEDRDPGWAIPFAVGGVMLLIGALVFYNYPGSPIQTAVNTSPQVERSVPPSTPTSPTKQ